jgi:hypothetical protein
MQYFIQNLEPQMKNETGNAGTAHGNHRVSIHISAPLEFTYTILLNREAI